jgi:hypothetical protein
MKLLRRPEVVQAFPFMKAPADKLAQSPKKRCCGKQRQNSVNLEGIKTAIGTMSDVDKQKLKGFLGANKVRLYFNNTKGQTIKQTIE